MEIDLNIFAFLSKSRVIFFFLALLCASALTLSFYSWNKVRYFSEHAYQISDSDLKYSVDSCNISGDSINIKGWIFNQYYPLKGTLIVTFKNQENEFMLPVFTFERGDVSGLFGRKEAFDKVGFNASINKTLISSDGSGYFTFYISNKDGIMNRVMKYECKK